MSVQRSKYEIRNTELFGGKSVEQQMERGIGKAKALGESQSFLHRVFRGLNEAVPGLGTFSQAAVSPVGAAVALATEALGRYRQKMREFNRALDTPASVPAQPGLLMQTPMQVAPASQAGLAFESSPEADRRPDYAAFAQLTEHTAQSLDTLNRTVIKLDTAVRQIQSRLDTNR